MAHRLTRSATAGVVTALMLALAAPAQAAPTRIVREDLPTSAQVRSALDLSRPLSNFFVTPTDQDPIANPDCATNGRPEATDVVVLPAARTRTESFTYRIPGAAWELEGAVQVVEYRTRAKARAALARVKASVHSATRYRITCEGVDLLVTGQTATGSPDVRGASFSWRNHVRSLQAGSWRYAVSTKGRRLVWVSLGRAYRADLDWSHGTPAAQFPRYPSKAYLADLTAVAAKAAL